MTRERAYPVDPIGSTLDVLVDTQARAKQPPKPCARRITHESCADPTLRSAITWCTLDEGHAGQCSGPPPRVIELDDFGPGRTKKP